MKIVKYYCDLCGEEIKVSDIAEVSISCIWNIDKCFNEKLMTCFDCWNNIIKNICEQKNKKTSVLSIIKNSINSHLQRGDKIKAVHVTSEDFETVKEESYVVIENPDTCFGYPLITDAEFTHIEVER